MLVSKYQPEALSAAFGQDLQLSAKQSWLRSSDTSPLLSESKAEVSTYLFPAAQGTWQSQQSVMRFI